MFAHIVVALQHRKSAHRSRNTHRSESRVPGSRKRPTVIHGRGNSNARRHLVVEQSPHALTQYRFQSSVTLLICITAVAVDAASEIAFEPFGDGYSFIEVVDDYEKTLIAKRLFLKSLRLPQELAA